MFVYIQARAINCLISAAVVSARRARYTHHGIQQRERSQVEEGLSRLVSHRFIHMVELIYDVVT